MAEDTERRGVRLTKASFAVCVAVVALAGNAFQLWWSLDPRRKPDPNERLRAAIEPTSAEPGVTLETYLTRTTAPRELAQAIERQIVADYPTRAEFLCAKDRKLAVQGYMVYANVTVEGLKHRSVDFSTTVYSAATARRIRSYEGQDDQVRLPPQELTSPTDSFVQAAFVQVPPYPARKYYARFELRAHEEDGRLGTLLAMAESEPFPGFVPRFPTRYPHCPAST